MTAPLVRHALAALILASLAGAAAGQGSPLALPPLSAQDASARIAVVVEPGLARTLDLPTEGLRQARRDMLDGLPVADLDLRALAESRDGLAAQRYLRRLLAAGEDPDPSDVAWFGAIAVATGRPWSLPDVVEALRRLDPATEPPERLRLSAEVLAAHAWAGNALALEAMVELNGEGRLLGPLSEETRVRLLDAAAAAGNARVPLLMALDLLAAPEPPPERLALARDYLGRAAQGGDLAAQAMALALLGRLDGGEAGSAAGSSR